MRALNKHHCCLKSWSNMQQKQTELTHQTEYYYLRDSKHAPHQLAQHGSKGQTDQTDSNLLTYLNIDARVDRPFRRHVVSYLSWSKQAKKSCGAMEGHSDGSRRERTATIFSPKSAASSSMRGAIMRQGPHHGAQKSTSTGTLLLSTNSSNV